MRPEDLLARLEAGYEYDPMYGRLCNERDQLKADNAKLRELAAKMAEALRVGSEWCDRECITVFGCGGMDECPIAKELRDLGVGVDE